MINKIYLFIRLCLERRIIAIFAACTEKIQKIKYQKFPHLKWIENIKKNMYMYTQKEQQYIYFVRMAKPICTFR